MAIEADVYVKVEGHVYGYKTLNHGNWENAKPLPEPKPMTALDVMWWSGIMKVYKNKNDNSSIKPIEQFKSCFKVEKYEWNELAKDRDTGKIVFLYDNWKEFNFENCKMEEG
jgi:hypothetical protein